MSDAAVVRKGDNIRTSDDAAEGTGIRTTEASVNSGVVWTSGRASASDSTYAASDDVANLVPAREDRSASPDASENTAAPSPDSPVS